MFESLALNDAAKHAQRARAEADRLNGDSLAIQDARQHQAKWFSGVFGDNSGVYRDTVQVG
jgi:hypothetical protein